ncbi:MAG: FAD/NAD(P)-binding protein [Methanobacteriota archaeon]|nr:MAG: FAD/NAD(P)-binding protein [Euryarchaeota archaeon]
MKKLRVILDEREVDGNPFQPDMWRIVRRYPLTNDVNFYQARAVDVDRTLLMDYLPGQFVMGSVSGDGEAPFCISSTPSRPGLLELCIRKMGTLTETVFSLKENQTIGIRGPYGNGFPIDKMEGKDILIIAGGMGAAPLRSLLLYALDNRDKFGKITYLHGARTPGEMLFREEFMQLKERDDLACLLSVDEDDTGAWTEKIGVVTKLFDEMEPIDAANTYAAVCGPPVMYKFVIQRLVGLNIPKHQILMTLERRMKCGIGKCGHCAIEYLYTCMDGPVFTYWDVLHMKELIGKGVSDNVIA